MLQIKNLCTTAGNFAVDNISLTVTEGECHVLLGSTGSGKTLILETIAGLRPIKSGQIWTGNYEITNEAPERRAISYVPQDLALFPHLTVKQNILYSQRFNKRQSMISQEINELIKYLGLEHLLPRAIHNLSGGERQRVALARAFATGNKAMLLDEPFSALNYTMKRSLWYLLFDLQKKYNLAVLMVTHDLEEAFFLADYVSVLYQGKVMQTGSKKDVFYKPNCIEVTKITGHYNYLPGKVVQLQGNACLVFCDFLDGNLHVNNPGLVVGEEVVMAIRTNNIEIINDNRNTPVDGINKVLCKVKRIHDTSHFQQIILTPEKQIIKQVDDVIVDVANMKNMDGYNIGQKVIASFPKDSISIFRQP